MRLFFVSLGCDKNRVDSEEMLGLLADRGMEFTDDETVADIIVINTCCFIGDAKEESINTILEMAEYRTNGPCKALIVTGCLAQRYQDEIHTEIPEVDAILGTNSIDSICEAVDYVLKNNQSSCDSAPYYRKFMPLTGLHKATRQILTTPGHYAYLKIAEGCNKNCTYCVIPSVRGCYRSVPIEDIVNRARKLVSGGVKELILVAQETTLYGTDLYGEKSLHKLLDELNAIDDLLWIRILYCYPEEIDDRLLDSMVRNDKVCHYLDIPIQHCNDTILRRMGRLTNKKELIGQIDHIREVIPDITLRTTLICGFPGETEEMHEELMQFVNDMEFDRLGTFAYSCEEGTPAAEFPDQVPEEQKDEWVREVMELQEDVIRRNNKIHIGRRVTAIVEGKVIDDAGAEGDIDIEDDIRELPDTDDEDDAYFINDMGQYTYVARTYRDAPDVDGYIFFQSPEEIMTGEVFALRVISAYDYDLIGEIL